MAASEKSGRKPRTWAAGDTEIVPFTKRDRQSAALNRDIRIVEEFAFRHPNGGNSKDFIAAAEATGYPFKSESTIRTIQSILVSDGLLLKDGRNQFRAPPAIVERVQAGQRTPILEKLSRSREWERRRERVRFELHRIYPPPAKFGAEDVFKHFPELRTVQNAYAYLTHFEKRSQILSFGDGLFGFKEDRAPVTASTPTPPIVAFQTVDRVREAARLVELYREYEFEPPRYEPGTLMEPLPECAPFIFGTELKPPLPLCVIFEPIDYSGPRTPTTCDIQVGWLDPETDLLRIKSVPSWMLRVYDPLVRSRI